MGEDRAAFQRALGGFAGEAGGGAVGQQVQCPRGRPAQAGTGVQGGQVAGECARRELVVGVEDLHVLPVGVREGEGAGDAGAAGRPCRNTIRSSSGTWGADGVGGAVLADHPPPLPAGG
ncbi:hypothetical protein GCM10020256_34190 [Streptomyces thermocoprophilus]